MNLRQQLAIDACEFLRQDELGEIARWRKYGTTTDISRTVRLVEQPEIQTIRRSYVWVVRDTTTITQGDTFTVTRGRDVMEWRALYAYQAETALQRIACHLRLTDTCTAIASRRYKTVRGSDGSIPEESGTSLRCKWFDSSAEIAENVSRRKMEGEWYCILEVLPELNTDTLLRDSSGRMFRIERMEHGFNRDDLPYAICTRSDS